MISYLNRSFGHYPASCVLTAWRSRKGCHGTQAFGHPGRRRRRLLGVDGCGHAGTFNRLLAGRKGLFEPEIEKHHGRVFKLMGDGLLAEFGSGSV